MPRYRMRCDAVLCFDVEAKDEMDAFRKGTVIAERYIDDGVPVVAEAGLNAACYTEHPDDVDVIGRSPKS